MKDSNLFKILSFVCLINFSANAHDSYHARPDAHAPMGVMRDHVHKTGEYMLSYRYNLMSMKGAANGGGSVSASEVLDGYMMAPKKMDMKMHMLGGMYGITDNFTIAAMASFVEKDMEMLNRNYQKINREASDFGDTKVNTMYQFLNNADNQAQFNLGISIPTGSIKQEYQGSRLAYGMQTGSGSYELLPGLSYKLYQNSYSYGAQLNGVFRLNDNNNDYKLGNSYNATAWVAKKLNKVFSVSSRFDYLVVQKIRGEDSSLNKMMSPANNTLSSGRRKLDFLLGTNFIVPSGALKGHRLAIEGGVPLYQNVNGTQLKNDYKVTLGWQKAFW